MLFCLQSRFWDFCSKFRRDNQKLYFLCKASKTIIPEAEEHFLTPSGSRDTHIVSGLGLNAYKV